MSPAAAVEAVNLSKSYGRTRVLRSINLTVPSGETVALLGANGAGKTTLLRLCATLMRPTHGKLRVLGLDPQRSTQQVRRGIGVVAHRPYLYDDLTGRENLDFYAQLYGLNDAERPLALLRAAGLAHAADRLVSAYSRGMQQRLALARAVLHDPALLLLDEPDTGLDQEALAFLEAMVTDQASGRTVIFTTHNVDLALRMSRRVLVVAGGGIVYDSPSDAAASLGFRNTYSQFSTSAR